MWKHFNIAIRLSLVTILILGVIYPLIITGVAQAIFPKQANGSLIKDGNHVIGSELIGQQFTKPEYFHPRPSAAGNGYDASASGGSNLGPINKKLIDRVKNDADKAVKDNPSIKNSVPVDMVTTSGSGLDPDITIANAYAQIPRVAKIRKASEDDIKKIVDENITKRQLGVLGEPRVNVLKLNMSLIKARLVQSDR